MTGRAPEVDYRVCVCAFSRQVRWDAAAATTETWSRASPCTHSHPEESADGIAVLVKARIFQPCRDSAN